MGWVCRRGTFVAGVRLSLGYVCRGVGLSQGGFVAGRVCLGWVCRGEGLSGVGLSVYHY